MLYKVIEGKAYLDGKPIETQFHLLNGDEVDDKLNLVKRPKQKIVGVVKLSEMSFMAKSPRPGFFYKKFVPTDLNYPIMAIKTRTKYSSHDKYAVVIPMDHLKGSTTFRCQADLYIGNVGEPKAEEDYILIKNDLKFKKYSKELIESIKDDDRSKDSRIDLTSNQVYSIDPDGCEDIDDAFDIKMISDNKFVVHVHIADVTRIVELNSVLDLEARKRGLTIYFPNKRFDMFPEIIATKLASLKEGEEKCAVTIKFEIENDKFKFIGIFKSKIINKKNFTYNEYDHLIKEKNISDDHVKFYDMVKENYGKILNGKIREIVPYDKTKFDSHYLIEVLMVLSNHLVGKYLNDTSPIVRISNGFKCDLPSNTDPYNIAKYLTIEKTKYGKSGSHKMIGFNDYVHFTSPIRRYADVYTHHLINYKLGLGKDPSCIRNGLIEHLNTVESNIKKVQRDSIKLELAMNKDILTENGYVVSHSIENKSISFFFPKLKTIFSLRLGKNNLMKINESKIEIKDDFSETSLEYGKPVPIEIYVFNKKNSLNQKFKIKLKDFNFLFYF